MLVRTEAFRGAGDTPAGGGGEVDFVQASSVYLGNSNATTHTLAYTCAVSPGSNRLLVLALCNKQNVDDFDSITYNGVAMTNAVFVRNTSSTPDINASIWYLLDADIPNDGASHNLVVDFAGTNSHPATFILLEYINVAQGAPHRTDAVANSGSSAATLTLTTVASGSVLIDVLSVANSNTTIVFGTDQNERVISGASNFTLAASDKLPAAHSGGSVAMSIDPASTNTRAYVAASWEMA